MAPHCHYLKLFHTYIVAFSTGKPVAIEVHEQHCDFESSDFCTFTPWYPDVYDGSWLIVRASDGFGPSMDHTTSSEAGHYIIVNGTKNQFEAVLASQPVTAKTKPLCLSFYYTISGIVDRNDLGEIEFNLGLKVGKHVYDDQLTIVQDNTNDNTWNKHQVTIRYAETHQKLQNPLYQI